MYTRRLELPSQPGTSFFLWGPRQSGKTTLLKQIYPDAYRIDLLKTDELMALLRQPSRLRQLVTHLPAERWVVIDEIQKAPQLLDEVHYLIQEEKRSFALCGSSARKVRRGHANLLGGRALRFELLGLTALEIGPDFDLLRLLNTGPLPSHYDHADPRLALRSYVDDYLREEVLHEGFTRNLPTFSDFLRIAALGDTGVVSFSNIARECGLAASTVRDHFGILEDTLLGAYLPSFTQRPKRRTIQAPKFYFRDVGVVNHLAQRIEVKPGSELFGYAFENWLFHELSLHSRYSREFYNLAYWQLTTGIEVDFILGKAAVAIEAKGKERVSSNDLKGLRQFKKEYPEVEHCLVVCLEKQVRRLDDGIWVLPYQDFLVRLWEGEWTAQTS
jgi:uncharacterized protein